VAKQPFKSTADNTSCGGQGDPLLTVLRELLDLTGSKYGCGEGQCGSCTVLIDGKARRSCMVPVWAAAGKQITTIEGLAKGEQLHPVQQAFLEEGAMQCAFCTSGMIMSAVSLLNATRNPSEVEIQTAMQGTSAAAERTAHCCRHPQSCHPSARGAVMTPKPKMPFTIEPERYELTAPASYVFRATAANSSNFWERDSSSPPLFQKLKRLRNRALPGEIRKIPVPPDTDFLRIGNLPDFSWQRPIPETLQLLKKRWR